MQPNQDRTAMRRFFCSVLRKQQQRQPLEPLEALIADIIDEHPEYHALLSDIEAAQAQHYTPEQGRTNPFLHMGMHIALREQAGTDRPTGIRPLYQQLCRRYSNRHQAEHAMMDVLGEVLLEAQQQGEPPDEQRYLVRLRQLHNKHRRRS